MYHRLWENISAGLKIPVQMELSSPSLEQILPLQFIVSTVLSPQVWNEGLMFNLWL